MHPQPTECNIYIYIKQMQFNYKMFWLFWHKKFSYGKYFYWKLIYFKLFGYKKKN